MILILCTGNSCRSQIAEGYLKFFLKNRANIYSAGVDNHEINSLAIKTMKDDGIDISKQTSNNINEFNEANFKIAFNFEYRFKMFGNFDGAFFADVGNIWNLLDNTEDSSRTFDGFNDLSELAIGNGVGLRFDSGLFIFRLDMGLKTHNPSLEKGKRWLTDFSLKKAVFNIGLNYPF